MEQPVTKVCAKCGVEQDAAAFSLHCRSRDGRRSECKQCVREYRARNRQRIQDYKREYRKRRRAARPPPKPLVPGRERQREYEKRRYNADVEYRLRCNLRRRLRDFVRQKERGTLEYLGCTLEHFKRWLSWQFDERMTWANFGTYWHLDHVRPCSSFDLTQPQHVAACFHWTNIQPLEAGANVRKSNRVDARDLLAHRRKVDEFKRQFSFVQQQQEQA